MVNNELVGGIPTPLKNDGVRQLGKSYSQYFRKKICSKPSNQAQFVYAHKMHQDIKFPSSSIRSFIHMRKSSWRVWEEVLLSIFFIAYTMVVNCHCYYPILRIHCLFLSNFENQLAMCLLVSECFCRNMQMLLPEHPKVVFFGTWLI